MSYWHGNAAKTLIMDRISGLGRERDVIVVDLGCGDGGDWPAFLEDHPRVTLHAYEPDARRASEAAARLTNPRAHVYSGDRPLDVKVQGDVVVSFSVFEHVWDRARYLRDAKRLLAPEGIFFLNYDDGHFRARLDLDLPSGWSGELRKAFENRMAKTWARRKRFDRYQARVDRAELDDRLLPEAGLRCEETFYSNLSDLKWLYRSVPAEKRPGFVDLWVEFERRLNEFREDGAVVRGDRTNLWQVMPSRTLVLRHLDEGTPASVQ